MDMSIKDRRRSNKVTVTHPLASRYTSGSSTITVQGALPLDIRRLNLGIVCIHFFANASYKLGSCCTKSLADCAVSDRQMPSPAFEGSVLDSNVYWERSRSAYMLVVGATACSAIIKNLNWVQIAIGVITMSRMIPEVYPASGLISFLTSFGVMRSFRMLWYTSV